MQKHASKISTHTLNKRYFLDNVGTIYVIKINPSNILFFEYIPTGIFSIKTRNRPKTHFSAFPVFIHTMWHQYSLRRQKINSAINSARAGMVNPDVLLHQSQEVICPPPKRFRFTNQLIKSLP